MSLASAGITQRVIQEAMPEFHLSPDLIDGVLTAIPPPQAGASVAWRRARLTRVIEEIAAFNPFDAVQARLAAQIVVAQFLAEDTSSRSSAPELTVEQMCRLRRTAGELMRTAERLERALARRQARAVPWRDAPATDGFDLDALDAVWCPDPDRRKAADPVQPEAETQAAPAPALAHPSDVLPTAQTGGETHASAPVEPAGSRRAADRGHAPARQTSLADRPALLCEAVGRAGEAGSSAGMLAAR